MQFHLDLNVSQHGLCFGGILIFQRKLLIFPRCAWGDRIGGRIASDRIGSDPGMGPIGSKIRCAKYVNYVALLRWFLNTPNSFIKPVFITETRRWGVLLVIQYNNGLPSVFIIIIPKEIRGVRAPAGAIARRSAKLPLQTQISPRKRNNFPFSWLYPRFYPLRTNLRRLKI